MTFVAEFFRPNASKLIYLGSLLTSIVFGLIASSANLLVVSLTIAVFVGAFMLTRPAWIVWMVLVMGMLLVGLAPLYDDRLGSKAGWAVSILCFILMALAFFKIITLPESRKNTPAFIWLLLAFFIYALLNSLVQWSSAEEFVGGIKRYFQIWGLIFALCWLEFDASRLSRLKEFFVLVALIQVPFAAYELIVLVPIRQSMWHVLPGMVPIDVVAGTFGSTLYGGGSSGEMSTFLIIMLAFLLSSKMQNMIPIRLLIILIPWILSPLFMGETKAVIIMLPILFSVLYRTKLIANPLFGLIMLIVCSLLMFAMGYAYLIIMNMSLDGLLKETLSYNLYEKGYGTNFLNRTTVLTFWASQQGAHDPVSLIFGNGLGSSHQQTMGHVDVRYPGYGIGLTTASTMLWDMGIFGCLLFLGIFTSAWRATVRLLRESIDPTTKADALAIQVAIALFLFHIFYRLELLENISFQIVFSTLLGYLAWLYRRHRTCLSKSHL
jgi:hypothetical protein